jgi:hypothetical protein
MTRQWKSHKVLFALLLGAATWGGFNSIQHFGLVFYWQGFFLLLPLQLGALAYVGYRYKQQ